MASAPFLSTGRYPHYKHDETMAYRHVGPCRLLIGNPATAGGGDMVELTDVEDVRINANIRTSYGSSAELAGAPLSTALYRMPPQPAIQATIHDAGLDILAELILGISVNEVLRAVAATTTTSAYAIGIKDVAVASIANILPGDKVVIGAHSYLVLGTVSAGKLLKLATGLLAAVLTNAAVTRTAITHSTLGLGDAFANITAPTLCVIPVAQAAAGKGAANALWVPGVIVQGLSDLVYNRPVAEEIQNPYSVEFMAVYTAQDRAAAPKTIPVNNRLFFWGPPDALGAPVLGWTLPAL